MLVNEKVSVGAKPSEFSHTQAATSACGGRSRCACGQRQRGTSGCGSIQLQRRKKRECSGACGVEAGLGLTSGEKTEQARVQFEGQVRAMQRCHAEDAL